MNFRELFIRDFGILRHQKIKNLSNNINVIGGFNRAGKTTFLEMIRYLPYGFPKRDDFIPANNQYDVEAVLEYEKQKYNLFTKGYSSPLLKKANKKEGEVDVEDFFGIDNFSYKQLYTISLDQLKRIPKSASSNKDKLQSLLLGAGFGELLELQDLKEKFINKAEKIGGKNGTINVKEFKEYYKEIKRGIKLRNNANSELMEFKRLKEKLENKINDIKDFKKEIEELSLKRDRLDLLKNNYSKLERIDQIIQNNNFIVNNSFADINLNSIYKNLTSLNEKYKNYKEKKKNNFLKKEKLLKELKNINNNWNDKSYLDYVLNLNFDFIENKKIDNYIYEFKSLRKNINKLKGEKETTENRIYKLKNKLEDISKKINKNYNKKYIIFSVFAIIIGLIMTLVSWPIAIIISFFGISGSYFYNKEKRDKVNFYEQRKIEIKKELNEEELKLNKLNNKIKKEKEKREEINIFLAKIYDKLELKKNIKVDILRDYFKVVNNLQEKIKDWRIKRNKVEENKNKLKKEFNKIVKKLSTINIINNKELQIDKDIMYLNQKIEKLIEWKKIKSTILSTLNTDRAKNAFSNYNNFNKEKEEKLWNIFFDFYRNYLSKDDVEENYKEVKEKLKKAKENLENAKNNSHDLKSKINKLKSSDKLKRARKIIFKNRKKLKKKALKYGKNLTSAFIIDKVYDKILNEMKEEIFNLTSNYLERITGKEYVKVFPAYELKKIDFKTILSDGSKNESIEVLSRGTKEQLFLAVRLSRIKAMDNKLPIIFDDSLVNFDSFHLKNTLDLITEISRENQVFILTCHPELIEKLGLNNELNNESIRYWKLKNGEFNKSSRAKLINYLKNSSN